MAEAVKSLKSVENKIPSFDHEPSEIVSNEIENLRSEIASLRELIAEKTGIAYEKVASSASNAASYVSDEATSVATTIRQHPAASTTVFTLIGAVGFAIGYAVATGTADSRQAWYRRYLNEHSGKLFG